MPVVRKFNKLHILILQSTYPTTASACVSAPSRTVYSITVTTSQYLIMQHMQPFFTLNNVCTLEVHYVMSDVCININVLKFEIHVPS